MKVQPVETKYAGCRFRSRLEARWATCFDALRIRWEYEPQGFAIEDRSGGKSLYLPDFLLTDHGTWAEIKGSDADLDRRRLEGAAISLPEMPAPTPGPRLLLLGPIPRPADHAWTWLGLDPYQDPAHDIEPYAVESRWAFVRHMQHRARLVRTRSSDEEFRWALDAELTAPKEALAPFVPRDGGVSYAYQAARSARFEHEEAA